MVKSKTCICIRKIQIWNRHSV